MDGQLEKPLSLAEGFGLCLADGRISAGSQGPDPEEKDTLGAQGGTRLVLWSRGAWVEETKREGGEMEKGRKSQEEGPRW